MSGLSPDARREWLRKNLAAKLGDIEPTRPEGVTRWKKSWPGAAVEGVTLATEPEIVVPLLLLRPLNSTGIRVPTVVIVSEGGKERILTDRRNEIDALLKSGIAVCLPDVRGSGETSPDTRHGPSSAEVSLSSTELMLGNTLLGARLKDLRTVVAYLSSRQDLNDKQIAVWGDFSAPQNPSRLLIDELPAWQIGPQIQYQAEPLGGLLAILTALYEEKVRAVGVRGGLASYVSMLDDAFTYVPGDVIVPGILEVADVSDITAALSPRPMLLQKMVDGRNRLVEGQDNSVNIASWLAGQLKESR